MLIDKNKCSNCKYRLGEDGCEYDFSCNYDPIKLSLNDAINIVDVFTVWGTNNERLPEALEKVRIAAEVAQKICGEDPSYIEYKAQLEKKLTAEYQKGRDDALAEEDNKDIAKWEYVSEPLGAICSNCKEKAPYIKFREEYLPYTSKYCPNCGKQMDDTEFRETNRDEILRLLKELTKDKPKSPSCPCEPKFSINYMLKYTINCRDCKDTNCPNCGKRYSEEVKDESNS